MQMPEMVAAQAGKAIEALKRAGFSIATAESCTGGLVTGALTSVPGASDVVYGGFITYANTAKSSMIGVPARLIRDYGAVSAQVARAMANGARNRGQVDLAVSVTGVAGPQGGSDRKPVGLVYIACATHEGTCVIERRFGDIGRDGVREASVLAALELVIEVAANGVEPARPVPADLAPTPAPRPRSKAAAK